MRAALAVLLLAPDLAWASCGNPASHYDPDDYDEQTQQDFLQNYSALSLTFSPVHGPVPHEGGRGSIGVDLVVIPPLSCEKRLVLYGTKIEDANVTPIAPKLAASFAFPGLPFSLYAGMAYVPPVRLLGQQTLLVSGELGFGHAFITSLPALQLGARLHFSTTKTVGDLASAFNRAIGPEVDDLYTASSVGLDVLGGWSFGGVVTPYVAMGFTDVTTFFYVGETGNVTNNRHPYASFVFSVGADGLVFDHFRWGAEFYGAPGGYSKLDPDVESTKAPAAYGHIYTARFRLAYEF